MTVILLLLWLLVGFVTFGILAAAAICLLSLVHLVRAAEEERRALETN